MDTMTNDETYNGYANRETWAFNLHWQNDQGLYRMVLEYAGDLLDNDQDAPDRQLGESVGAYVQDVIREYDNEGRIPPAPLAMMRNEVGSFWRIDYAEVGAAVRESLDVEGVGD